MNKLVVALATLLAIPLVAAASPSMAPTTLDSTSPWYVTTRAGAYVPQSDDLDLLSFNNGFATEVQLGRRYSPNFAAELGLGWFSTATDSILGSKATISVIPVTATAKGILPFGNAEVYGLGGVGAYFGTLEIETPEGDFDDDDSSFGLHLGAGAQYALTQKLSLGVEARYLFAELGDVDMNGFLLNGGVAFRF